MRRNGELTYEPKHSRDCLNPTWGTWGYLRPLFADSVERAVKYILGQCPKRMQGKKIRLGEYLIPSAKLKQHPNGANLPKFLDDIGQVNHQNLVWTKSY